MRPARMTLLAFVLGALTAAPANAQAQEPDRRAFFAITVADLNGSIRWYTAAFDPRRIGLQKVGVWVDSVTYRVTLARLRQRGARFIGSEITDPRLDARQHRALCGSSRRLAGWSLARLPT